MICAHLKITVQEIIKTVSMTETVLEAALKVYTGRLNITRYDWDFF
jgi:hypothetical protein